MLDRDTGKPWKPPGAVEHGEEDAASAGGIVFHDAWPEAWPRLIVDIVNNHHPKYYQGIDAPGDWDAPNPTYFLAIPPGATFTFLLNKRRDGNDRLLALAQEWLDGGLTQLGCGAKTAAGYGVFHSNGSRPAQPPTRREFSATLELVTPAYLAGAEQAQEDCTLREASLRGLLRWWWRTLHAGFVEMNILRKIEAAVWGNTDAGGAVQLQLTPLLRTPPAEPSPYKAIDQGQLRFSQQFLRQHGLTRSPQRTTQGLQYAAYGMDEPSGDNPRRRRWVAPAGWRWQLRLMARTSRFGAHALPAELLLDQAKAALWWFTKLGGVGSKSRKGFGSFADPPELQGFDAGSWLALGGALRASCGLPAQEWRPEWVQSPSLRLMRRLADAGDNPVADRADTLA